jgi:hypothetical protein
MTGDRDGALGSVDDPADDVDQRGLAGAVRAKEREYLALANLQIDPPESLESRRIGLGEVRDGNNGLDGLAKLHCGRDTRRLWVTKQGRSS